MCYKENLNYHEDFNQPYCSNIEQSADLRCCKNEQYTGTDTVTATCQAGSGKTAVSHVHPGFQQSD